MEIIRTTTCFLPKNGLQARSRETLYRYDLMGRRTASRDGLGNETEFQYETI